jgi:hypothetical protein
MKPSYPVSVPVSVSVPDLGLGTAALRRDSSSYRENFAQRRDPPIAIVSEQMVTIDEGRPEACGLRASVILER